MTRTRIRTVSALLLLVVALGACNTTPAGDPAVHARIKALTDCKALQTEFDTASANHDRVPAGSDQAKASTAYMETANSRMKELSC